MSLCRELFFLSERFQEHLLVHTLLEFLYGVPIFVHSAGHSIDSFILYDGNLIPAPSLIKAKASSPVAISTLNSHPQCLGPVLFQHEICSPYKLWAPFSFLAPGNFPFLFPSCPSDVTALHFIYRPTAWKLHVHTGLLQTCTFSCPLVSPLVRPIENSNLKLQIRTPDNPPEPAPLSVFGFSVNIILPSTQSENLTTTSGSSSHTRDAIHKSPDFACRTCPETGEFSQSPLLTPWSKPPSRLTSITEIAFNALVLDSHSGVSSEL